MSTNDTLHVIEDEPYHGLYRGAVQAGLKEMAEAGHLPDRFDLAEILRRTREGKGLTLDEVAEITRVRRVYLEAFEQAAYDVLPPRAFAIGYVKAYAKALDLDEETLADMFKRDVLEPQARLHAPSGASLDDVKPNYRLYIGAALSLVAAIIVWNVVQRQPSLHARADHVSDGIASQSWTQGVPLIHNGVLVVTKPEAAPQDQDVPAPYATPGLEEGFASIEAAHNSSSTAPVSVTDVMQMRKAFNPHGAVYGAPPENSAVTIQTRKSVNLVVRGTDGIIYFAHQLGIGEAYRLPQVDPQNLVIEVSDFSAYEVYYNGEYAGPMDALVTPVSKLNAKAAAMSNAQDARQASSGQIAKVYTPPPEAPKATPRMNGPIPYAPSVKKATIAPIKVEVPEDAAEPAQTSSAETQ